MDHDRFIRFIEEEIILEGDYEYENGDSMTEDAKAFLEHYRMVVGAWEIVRTMTEKAPVTIARSS